jgi:hypothetical protein
LIAGNLFRDILNPEASLSGITQDFPGDSHPAAVILDFAADLEIGTLGHQFSDGLFDLSSVLLRKDGRESMVSI